MHGRDSLTFQRQGAVASRMRRSLPSTYVVPEFVDEASIVTFARELVRLALIEDIDPRRVDAAIRGAHLALASFSAQTQAKVADALLRLERGGPALTLMTQFINPTGRRTPIPGRSLVSLPADTESSAS